MCVCPVVAPKEALPHPSHQASFPLEQTEEARISEGSSQLLEIMSWGGGWIKRTFQLNDVQQTNRIQPTQNQGPCPSS